MLRYVQIVDIPDINAEPVTKIQRNLSNSISFNYTSRLSNYYKHIYYYFSVLCAPLSLHKHVLKSERTVSKNLKVF